MEMNDFIPNKGNTYRVYFADGTVLELCLTAIEALSPREKPNIWPESLPFRNEPFSLIFQGPPGIRLEDGCVPIQDDNDQVLQIGLSAFAEDEKGIYYQAIFN